MKAARLRELISHMKPEEEKTIRDQIESLWTPLTDPEWSQWREALRGFWVDTILEQLAEIYRTQDRQQRPTIGQVVKRCAHVVDTYRKQKAQRQKEEEERKKSQDIRPCDFSEFLAEARAGAVEIDAGAAQWLQSLLDAKRIGRSECQRLAIAAEDAPDGALTGDGVGPSRSDPDEPPEASTGDSRAISDSELW